MRLSAVLARSGTSISAVPLHVSPSAVNSMPARGVRGSPGMNIELAAMPDFDPYSRDRFNQIPPMVCNRRELRKLSWQVSTPVLRDTHSTWGGQRAYSEPEVISGE